MKYWVWSVTRENWEIVKHLNVWAAKSRSIINKLKKGDIIIFYVKGTNTFRGIFKTTSDWYETQKIIWSDEIKEKGIIYPHQIMVEPIILGEAYFPRLVPRLNFIEKKWPKPQSYIMGSPTGPANFGRPIEERDYKIILEELRKKPTPFAPKPVRAPTPTPIVRVVPTPAITHSEMIKILCELGELFRKYPESEYFSGPYRYDVVWKRTRAGNPTKVFEVHHKGVLDSALAKLKHAYDIWNAGLFIIITEEKDKDKARILLEGSFHEIGHVTTILQPEVIKELHEFKTKFREIERKLR